MTRRVRLRRSLVALVAAAVVAPGAAHAATITQPAAGQTVSLEPTFSWTMAPNETLPSVEIARTPSYADPNPVGICSGDDEHPNTTSCKTGFPLDGGTWYGFVTTDDNDSSDMYQSPIVRFTVPYTLALDDSDPWGGNPHPFSIGYAPHPLPLGGTPGAKGPYSGVDVQAWLNDPGAKVSIAYVVKHGRKVMKTAHHVVPAGPEEDWSFEDLFVLRHLRGIKNGARMGLTVTLSADGASLRKTGTIRNPPPRK